MERKSTEYAFIGVFFNLFLLYLITPGSAVAADAQRTLADFRTGKFRHQSAEDVIATLRQSLDEPEDRFNFYLTYPQTRQQH